VVTGQVAAMPDAGRQQVLTERREEAIQAVHGEVEMEGDQRREHLEAQLITMTAARDEAQNGRALAEQLLVSLLRQLLPGQAPVYLFSVGVRELDGYGLNQVLARYRLRLRSRRRASARQVKTRVGERHWEGRSLFWLEPLLVSEGTVPEFERADPDQPSGRGEGV
jgi:hypothetical protein